MVQPVEYFDGLGQVGPYNETPCLAAKVVKRLAARQNAPVCPRGGALDCCRQSRGAHDRIAQNRRGEGDGPILLRRRRKIGTVPDGFETSANRMESLL
jgi:hypothetical protein